LLALAKAFSANMFGMMDPPMFLLPKFSAMWYSSKQKWYTQILFYADAYTTSDNALHGNKSLVYKTTAGICIAA